MFPARVWLRVAPAALMVAWGGNHFSPLLLLYRETNGYSAFEVDFFFAAYIVGLIPGFLASGPLSDRFGRKPLMILGVVLSVAGSLVLAAGSASFAALTIGRFVSGLSVAIAMTVGTTWIKELSGASVPPASAARRASLSLTLGFGLGAGVSGVLAQWGPLPTLIPYLVHVVLTIATGALILTTPESRTPGRRRDSLFGDLRPAPAYRRRFGLVVVPAALWVFAAPALAFAVAPALVTDEVGTQGVAFATLLAIVVLTAGVVVQPFTGWFTRVTRGRPLVLGLAFIVLGTMLLVVEVLVDAPLLTLVAALVFGAGYGICIVCGLIEVQGMASPDNLGGLTAVYYSLTYVGFVLPAVLSALVPIAPYPVSLTAVAALCLACAIVVYTAYAGGALEAHRPHRLCL